jgi:hypothetical protein
MKTNLESCSTNGILLGLKKGELVASNPFLENGFYNTLISKAMHNKRRTKSL